MRLAVFCLGILAAVLVQPCAVAGTPLTDAMGRANDPDYRTSAAGNLHLVWHDAAVDNGAVMFKLFNTAGAVLIDDTQVNASTGSANISPVTELDGSARLFVVWQSLANQDLYLMRLEPLLDDLDGSPATLDPIDPLNIKPEPEFSLTSGQTGMNPAMAIDSNGDLHIVWETGIGSPVKYLKVVAPADPAQRQLVGPVDVSVGTTGTGSDLPDIAIDAAGNVHVVYTHAGGQANEVYYAMLDGDAANTGSAGTALITPSLLTLDDGLAAGSATVSVDLIDGRVYVVYAQATGAGEHVYLSALDPALRAGDGLPANLATLRLHETAITGTPAVSSWRVFSRIGADRRVHAAYLDFDSTNCTDPNFTSANYTITNAHVTYDGKVIAREALTDSGATPGCNPRARLAPRGNRVVWTDSATGVDVLEIFSATFSRAEAGESGFTCSLGNPANGAARAADLWLLLAFIAVLWRVRARSAR